jgi:hypothetical protein
MIKAGAFPLRGLSDALEKTSEKSLSKLET